MTVGIADHRGQRPQVRRRCAEGRDQGRGRQGVRRRSCWSKTATSTDRQARLARRPALSAAREGRKGTGHARRLARAALIDRKGAGMRQLVVGSAAARRACGLAGGRAAAAARPKRNVRTALERIARIDPQLHSVIAVDPTAIDQARRGRRGQPARPARRPAGADQGQYRKRRPAADDRRQPRAREQRHQPRRAAGRAAARGRRGHPRQDQS